MEKYIEDLALRYELDTQCPWHQERFNERVSSNIFDALRQLHFTNIPEATDEYRSWWLAESANVCVTNGLMTLWSNSSSGKQLLQDLVTFTRNKD
jgi:hypothetical protein